MYKKVYKVRSKTDSSKYWLGYGSRFGEVGTQFTSLAAAGDAIRRSKIKSLWGSGQTLADQVDIIEYEITTVESDVIDPHGIIKMLQIGSHIQKTYGSSFLNLYRKLQETGDIDKYKYAFEVAKSEYLDFRESLKTLGYSSRAYKKVGTWIFLESSDVAMRIKLLDKFKRFVNLEELRTEVMAMYNA